MRTRAVVAAAIGACIAVCAPTLASAAVTIGGDVAARGELTPCGGAQPCEFAQVTLAGGQMSAPLDGVVVRWRVVGSSGPLALRVVRPAGSAYTFVSSSTPATPRSTSAETFPTRQPIRAGDYVGVELSPTAQVAMVRAAPAGDAGAAWQFVPDGQTAVPVFFLAATSFAYNADVEPDADHDGFGDETQDKCPTDASTQDSCPPATPAAGPAVAPATAPQPDRTPAHVSSPTHSVRLSKGDAIGFVVAASEETTGAATGTISLVNPARTVHFAKRRIALRGDRRTTVKLRLASAGATLVRRALARHAALKARVTLSVADAAGNQSTTRLVLRLRR